MDEEVLNFYTLQSKYTDLGEFASMVAGLSDNITEICKCVRNVIEHYHGLNSNKIKSTRLRDIDIRYNYKILECISEKSYKNIYQAIAFKDKVIGTCRSQALLTCGILREKSIAARIRYCYNTYFFNDFNHEQVVVEYWSFEKEKWVMIDPAVHDAILKKRKIAVNFDFHDVPSNKSMAISTAWLACRNGKLDANLFGAYSNHRKSYGLGYMRMKLYQDLACLNKIEVIEWDRWGTTLNNCEAFEVGEKKHCDYLANLLSVPNLQSQGWYENILNLKEYVRPIKGLSKSPFSGNYWVIF